MSDRPNILLFLTDDHGRWASGPYGLDRIATPHLDRLAAEGGRFDRAFSPCPVCSPARACVLTGETPSQLGIHDWLQEDLPPVAEHDWLGDTPTLFTLLHAAGYHTALSGKWHLGDSDRPPRGANRCLGFASQYPHHGEHKLHLDGRPLTLRGNKSRIISDHAERFIEEAPSDRPWFTLVGLTVTHSPYGADAHDPESVAAVSDADLSDLPVDPPHPWRNNEGTGGNRNVPDPAQTRERWRGYLAAVAEIDRAVGRIVEPLRESGKLDRTLVIYTSDHGCALGQQGFWGKGNSTRPLNMLEVSIRVPLLVRPPTALAEADHPPAPPVIDRLVDHYDTFRTVCDYADTDPPGGTAGRSYRPLLSELSTEWEDVTFGEYGDLRMIRTARWKLVRRYGPDHGPDELFDLADDPDEAKNLIDRPEHRETQAGLNRRLDAWYADHEDSATRGLRVAELPQHNPYEAWRDGLREAQTSS